MDINTRGLLETIQVGTQVIETRTYDAAGRLTNIDRPSVDETRTYDELHRVTSIANNDGGTNDVGTASYTYDANGNKLSETWTGVMSAWNFTTENGGDDGYDDEDRFTRFNQAGQNRIHNLTRSSIGNISSIDFNGSTTTRGFSDIHELTSVGGVPQIYDVDGNLKTAKSGVDFTWDEAGMMKTSNVSAGDSSGIEGFNEYAYAPDQKRVSKRTTRNGNVVDTVYIYAGKNCIAEYREWGKRRLQRIRNIVYGKTIDNLGNDRTKQRATPSRDSEPTMERLGTRRQCNFANC